MASHPWQTHNGLLFSIIACALNYRQAAGFVKAADKHPLNGEQYAIRLPGVHSLPLCLK